MIEIKNMSGDVISTADKSTIRGAIEEAAAANADLQDANLRGADLRCADLRGANLRGADLQGASLQDADLRGADLRGADLRGASLRDTDLRCADLRGADLRCADLRGADLRCASLRDADLRCADLRGADLQGADLQDADSQDAVGVSRALAAVSHIPPTGPFWGWKKCKDSVLVKLLIPESAKRSHASGRKCRASEAIVLEVIGDDVGVSGFDNSVQYRVGETVSVEKFEDNRWNECAPGIHFFLTREEAEAYAL